MDTNNRGSTMAAIHKRKDTATIKGVGNIKAQMAQNIWAFEATAAGTLNTA